MRALAAAALCLVAGCAKGVALDLTVDPRCVDDQNAVANLLMTINLTPVALLDGGANTVPFDGPTFFAHRGTSNRVVMILPDATKHADVSVQAYDAATKEIGHGEFAVGITGPNIYSGVLPLENANCPAPPPDGGSGGDGGDGGVVSPIGFRGSSNVAPKLNATSIMVPRPAMAAQNDVIVLVLMFNGQLPNVTPPDASWIMQSSLIQTHGPTSKALWWYHVVGAAEPSSYPFGFSQSSTVTAAAAAYRGVSTGNPIQNFTTIEVGVNTGPPFALPSVSVSTPSTAVLLLGHVYSTTAPTWTAPSSLGKREDQGSAAIFDGPVGTGLYSPGMMNVSDNNSNALIDLIVLAPQ